ncbi:uncharacterized protein EDB93DRAFT_1289480 [Suillus bovinus]|uniref:uncharacterized protein n=1 Tax=Suillus bovinus TaxID=48563 RepID=UPI001B868993|nr:uncharacterized protein EDB93DRAFT_1289480 [Suillus bovinus]KAG2144377.1 hypothetical protein EDB93DRAFT_1289480 [Suillus bovinus]
MSNHRTPAHVDQSLSANPSSGSSEQPLQDNQPHSQGHSSASFHQSTSVPPTTTDQQWFPPSQQMIVTNSSFYDPTQSSGFTAQQSSMNVWNTQFTGPGGEYFPRQNPTYQQPYAFEGAGSTQYSFVQDQVQVQEQQQHSQQPRVIPTPRRSARGGSRTSGYYRQRGAESQQHAGQYSQVPPSVPPNPPSTQPPPPQPSQQPTGQSLAAQRTTELIAGQFPPVQADQQHPAQQPQPHFSPPPTQSQFQIQQTQFPPTPQFSQSQFSQPHHPHVSSQSHTRPHVPTQSHTHVPSQSQSHAHPHVQSHTQSQPQLHAPPNPPRQSQHYSGPSDPYYLQSDMYYAINTQGNQSAPSLHAHSTSPHSPFATFGPHTPPVNSQTPSSDSGPLLGLPRSHDSVSPASYASHPTSSSFDDSSSGHPVSSVSSSNVHMASHGMGHAATSSISTVTPGSPPIVAAPQQQQQQQQRVQIRQRPIVPITPATATAQAGPARPPIVPKPPAPRPATNRRARAPKRPRPSTSQGGEVGVGTVTMTVMMTMWWNGLDHLCLHKARLQGWVNASE